MKREFDIVIAGCGIVGLTLAALLARQQPARFRLHVVDAGPRPVFDPAADIALRVSAVSAGNERLFDRLGAWRGVLAQRAGVFREMRVWDSSRSPSGPEALHFDAAEFALPALGHIVENVLLQAELLRVLEARGIQPEFGVTIENLAVSGGRVEVMRGDGGAISADLVVGADGAGSAVRRLAGIAAKSWSYPQSAFVTHMVPGRGHRECAWQRFLPEGPLALLPLGDGRVSIVWSTTPEQAEAALAAADDELSTMLTAASDNVLGVLRPAGSRGAFPLRARHAAQYALPGIVLVGDAAHSIHPLAGQGANLGIADAACLAEVLSAAAAGGEYPGDLPVLRRYERARKGANQAMLWFVDALNRLFLSEAPPLSALRAAGMRLFNQSGPLRRRVAGTALGLRA